MAKQQDDLDKYLWDGRIGRIHCASLVFIISLIYPALNYLAQSIVYIPSTLIQGLTGIITLVVIFLSLLLILSLYIRRAHDMGKSGWWSLMALLPVVGWVFFFFLPGQDGSNIYGKPPTNDSFANDIALGPLFVAFVILLVLFMFVKFGVFSTTDSINNSLSNKIPTATVVHTDTVQVNPIFLPNGKAVQTAVSETDASTSKTVVAVKDINYYTTGSESLCAKGVQEYINSMNRAGAETSQPDVKYLHYSLVSSNYVESRNACFFELHYQVSDSDLGFFDEYELDVMDGPSEYHVSTADGGNIIVAEVSVCTTDGTPLAIQNNIYSCQYLAPKKVSEGSGFFAWYDQYDYTNAPTISQDEFNSLTQKAMEAL